MVLLTLLLMADPADARRGRPSSCPVVTPVAGELGVRLHWLTVSGGRVVGLDDDGLVTWATSDGAKPRRIGVESTWPKSGWVVDGDELRNPQSGAVVGVDGKERAAGEAVMRKVDAVTRLHGFTGWHDYGDATVWVWNGGDISSFSAAAPGAVGAVAPAVDGGLFVAVEEDIERRDASGAVVDTFRGAPIKVESLAADPDGRWLAVGAYTGMLNLFDLETRSAVWSWPAAGQPVFSPNADLVLLAMYDTADVVSVATGCHVATLPARGSAVWLDDRTVGFIGADGRLRRVEVGR